MYTQRPVPTRASTSAPVLAPRLYSNGSVERTRSTYLESFSPRKYRPRSWTQPAHVSVPRRLGVENTGSVGTTTSIGAFSSVTRPDDTLAGYGPYCASLNSNLLY